MKQWNITLYLHSVTEAYSKVLWEIGDHLYRRTDIEFIGSA